MSTSLILFDKRMSDKQATRARQPPPISLLTRKLPRTRSVSNDLEQEPRVKPARVLERQTSVTSVSDSIPNIGRKRHVTQLVEQFDQSRSRENVHRSIHSSSTHLTPIYNSSTDGKILLDLIP